MASGSLSPLRATYITTASAPMRSASSTEPMGVISAPPGRPAAEAVSIIASEVSRRKCWAAVLAMPRLSMSTFAPPAIGFLDARGRVVQAVEKLRRGHAVVDGADQAGVRFGLNEPVEADLLSSVRGHI